MLTTNTELSEKLYTQYPEIFANLHNSDTIIGERGIECGDGWYDLIDRLCFCFCIQARVAHEKGMVEPVIAVQVKRK